MTVVLYSVYVVDPSDCQDFYTLQEAKNHALYVAAKRRACRSRYASGSLEWNQANGWSAPVRVDRIECERTRAGTILRGRFARKVFTAPSI